MNDSGLYLILDPTILDQVPINPFTPEIFGCLMALSSYAPILDSLFLSPKDDLEIWMGMRMRMMIVMVMVMLMMLMMKRMVLSSGNSAASKMADGKLFLLCLISCTKTKTRLDLNLLPHW